MLVPLAGDAGVNVGPVVERVLGSPEVSLPGRYVDVVASWMESGEILRLWGRVVGEVTGKAVRTVYVASGLETVDRLWPGLGKEMGTMMKVLEEFGKKVWRGKEEGGAGSCGGYRGAGVEGRR